jgi:hypothetical protein
MKKILIIFVFQFMGMLVLAQIPEEGRLLQVHSINNLGDTININNPIEGSLIYVSNTKSTFQKYSNGWRLWYQGEEINIDSLEAIVNSFDSTNCCFQYQYVNCGSATSCIGDTVNCGIVIDINSTNDTVIIVALDEYEYIQQDDQFQSWAFPSNSDISNPGQQASYFGGMSNSAERAVFSGPLAVNYKADGCSSQQWILPTIDMALAMESNLTVVNAILHIMDKKKINMGDEYWLINNVGEPCCDYGYFIKIGSTGLNGSIKRDSHHKRKKIRPVAIVPL